MAEAKFDLEERLLDFAVRVIRVTESMKRTRAGMYVADQLLRAGTSPYGQEASGPLECFARAGFSVEKPGRLYVAQDELTP